MLDVSQVEHTQAQRIMLNPTVRMPGAIALTLFVFTNSQISMLPF